MPKIQTDDSWFGGQKQVPKGPIGHAQTVLSSSTAATRSATAPNQLRSIARAISAQRRVRRRPRRIFWDA
jgi:hypothetical protein